MKLIIKKYSVEILIAVISIAFFIFYPRVYTSYFEVSARNEKGFKEFVTQWEKTNSMDGPKLNIKEGYGRELRVLVEGQSAKSNFEYYQRIKSDFLQSSFFDVGVSPSISSTSLNVSNSSHLIDVLKKDDACYQIYLGANELLIKLKRNFFFRTSKSEEIKYNLEEIGQVFRSLRCIDSSSNQTLQGLLLIEINKVADEFYNLKMKEQDTLGPYVDIGIRPSTQNLIMQAMSIFITGLLLYFLSNHHKILRGKSGLG